MQLSLWITATSSSDDLSSYGASLIHGFIQRPNRLVSYLCPYINLYLSVSLLCVLPFLICAVIFPHSFALTRCLLLSFASIPSLLPSLPLLTHFLRTPSSLPAVLSPVTQKTSWPRQAKCFTLRSGLFRHETHLLSLENKLIQTALCMSDSEKRKRVMNGERQIRDLQTHNQLGLCLKWYVFFCWRLASRVHYSELTLLAIYCECWALRTELFEMMSLASRSQNNRPLPPLPMTRSPPVGFGGDYWRQTLTEFRPSCNYFTSLCQSLLSENRLPWKSRPDREGEREGGREGVQICCDIKWKAY